MQSHAHYCTRLLAVLLVCTFGANRARGQERAYSTSTLTFVGRELVSPEALRPPGFRYAPFDPTEMQRVIDGCLMIRDLRIVNDPRASGLGTWSLGHLMREIANEKKTGISARSLVEKWLTSAGGQFESLTLSAWDSLSGNTRTLEHLPFRLLAIVNRIDLRDNLVLSEPPPKGGAGELRFVYGLCDAQGKPVDRVTIILEYQVRKRSFADVREWAAEWYALRRLPFGSPRYKAALERLTDQIVRSRANPENQPNESALAQVRHNDGVTSKAWLFKEFRLNTQVTGYIGRDTTKQTPNSIYNQIPRLDHYLNANQSQILAQKYHVPTTFEGEPFLAEDSSIGTNRPDFFWNGTEPDKYSPDARHLFSLNTCNGCHSKETSTQFFHVFNRPAAEMAELSDFLTGVTVPDPTGQPDPTHDNLTKRRRFADLPRRAVDLRDLVIFGTRYERYRQPMGFVH